MRVPVLCMLLGMQLINACQKATPGNIITGLKAGNSTLATPTYYVDAQNGNDTQNGTSEATAWKTFTKVNATTFQPGDSILLKRGSIWTTQLYPKGSGTAASPIVISDYGSGNMPLIALGGTAGAAVYLVNQSGWTIRHLEVTNQTAIRGTTYREGIYVQNQDGGVISNISILDNYVHDVSGSFQYASSDPHAFGGICVVATGATGADRFDNILIQGNTVTAVGRTGIVTWDNVWSGSGQASTNVKIRQNTLKNIDSDGILTFGCNGAIVEYNVANTCGNYAELGGFNGSCGIWCTRGADCIVQYNEVYNTKVLLDNADGQAFDHDYDAVRGIVQYNYSHDNAGGFILFCDGGTTSANCVARYNISQNDRTRIVNFAGGIEPNSQIYNNTIYIKSGLATNIIDHSWDLDMSQPYSFRNNIIYNLGTGIYKIPGTNGVFDYNMYAGNHPVSEPAEVNKLTGDPALTNPGSGGIGITTVDGYQLITGSPAIGSGVSIVSNGGKDYWGNGVPATGVVNRGAYNGPGIGSPTGIVDNLDDFSKIYTKTANMILDHTNPAYFANDNSRVSRSDGNTGTIVYHYTNISGFSAILYKFSTSTDLTKVKYYTSDNGTAWTLLTTTYSTPVATASGWFQTTFTPVGALPAGTKFLKMELTDTGSWATQLGQINITF